MNNSSVKIVITILFIVIVFILGYAKVPAVRDAVNDKFPQAKAPLTQLVGFLQSGSSASDTPDATAAASATPAAAPVAAGSPASGTSNVAAAPGSPLAANPLAPVASGPAAGAVDIAEISQNRAEWPKTVKLKKAVQFPAVMGGKQVGSVQVPAGTEAILILIKDNKVGLEYNGGGAMVDPTDTDLIEQVIAKRSGAAR